MFQVLKIIKNYDHFPHFIQSFVILVLLNLLLEVL